MQLGAPQGRADHTNTAETKCSSKRAERHPRCTASAGEHVQRPGPAPLPSGKSIHAESRKDRAGAAEARWGEKVTAGFQFVCKLYLDRAVLEKALGDFY